MFHRGISKFRIPCKSSRQCLFNQQKTKCWYKQKKHREKNSMGVVKRYFPTTSSPVFFWEPQPRCTPTGRSNHLTLHPPGIHAAVRDAEEAPSFHPEESWDRKIPVGGGWVDFSPTPQVGWNLMALVIPIHHGTLWLKSTNLLDTSWMKFSETE